MKTLPCAGTDSYYTLLVAKVQTRLKATKVEKRIPKWNLKRIKSKENHVKDVMEEKFSQIDWVTGIVEES